MTTPTQTADPYAGLAADVGERLPFGDLRGPIAHTHYGRWTDEHIATADADWRYRRLIRTATPLERALLTLHAMLPADDARHVTATARYVGPIRCQRFYVGPIGSRTLIHDDRETPQS